MRKIVIVLVSCSLICIGAYRWGDVKWESAKLEGMKYLYSEIMQFISPCIYNYEKRSMDLLLTDIGCFFSPQMRIFYAKGEQEIVRDEDKGKVQAEVMINEESLGVSGEVEITGESEEMNPGATEITMDTEMVSGEKDQESVVTSADGLGLKKEVTINRVKLQDFDYLRQIFYQIDNTTTIGSDQLNVSLLLEKDMTLQNKDEGPKILIYHTHSQEAYKDSVAGDENMTIVGVGDYLETLLEERYGIAVLHHKGQYDVPSRDNAYSNALPEIERVLQENPSIEVVIDLHRDGVPESRHFVTEVNGKPTAQIMFFNGLSRTTSQGELTYLPNPYVADNLAFSFQMQLAAAEYYPGLTRKIYLKGYRYNLHLKPKSLLIEVGAQTNTFEEAKNAMEPLANILALVLTENTSE